MAHGQNLGRLRAHGAGADGRAPGPSMPRSTRAESTSWSARPEVERSMSGSTDTCDTAWACACLTYT
eukprot:9411570-Heterocapsa_arctica.AAC.1